MNTKLILQLFGLFLSILSISAQDMPNITPPSPTAYELGKYGQAPVGLFTGTPSIHVPLYQYQTNNLSIPISLSYNSNGIKVDQLSSNVGLGWSLNVGGVISRITRDKSDEYNNYFYPDEDIHKPGGKKTPMALEFFQTIAENPNIDSETDVFMYNFNGHTGQFVFDKNKNIILVPHKDFQMTYFEDQREVSFKITTSDGIEYFFTETEINLNRASGGGNGGHHGPPEDTTTAWYLSQIRHPKGDIVSFIYSDNNYGYVSGKSQSFYVTPGQWICDSYFAERNNVGTVISNNLRIVGKKLVRIESNNPNDGVINLQSNIEHPKVDGHDLVSKIVVKNKNNTIIERFDFSYLMTSKKRVFLEEVVYKDPSKNYRFEYIEPSSFPERLSYSQDHWGYYNAKNNNYLFPNPRTLGPSINPILTYYDVGANKNPDPSKAQIGLLKQITYPTKGYERFEYEGNSYYGEKVVSPPKVNLSLSANTGPDEFGSGYNKSKVINVPFDQTITAYGSTRFNSNACDSYLDVGKSRAVVSIVDNQTNQKVMFYKRTLGGQVTNIGTSITITENSNIADILANLKEGHSYTITLSPGFECVQSNFTLWYIKDKPQKVATNITSGGLRIKSIKSFDAASSIANTRVYYYGKKESLNTSSAEKGQTPFYVSNNIERKTCNPGDMVPCSFSDIKYYELHSNSTRQLFNTSVNSTYYQYVTVSHGGSNFENGGEEHEFIIHNDYPGNSIFGNPIESSPWVNLGWSNGLKKKTSIFKKEGNGLITLSETINTYKEDTRHFKKTYGYRVVKKHEGEPCTTDITYTCSQDDVTKIYYKGYECLTNHKHNYFIGTKNRKCIASGADNVRKVHYHHCYTKPVGTILTYPHLLDHFDFMEYSTNSYWHYLSSTLEKQYDENGLNPVHTETRYYYDNPEHLQLTRVEITDSKEDVIKTKTIYPQDIANPTIAEQKLIDLHQIATPILVEALENDITLSVQKTEFGDQNLNGIPFPKELKLAKADYDLETRLVYHKYDQWGNPLEMFKKGDTYTTYVWGYQGKYPVAKAIGATFAEIAIALGISQSQLENLSDNQLSLLDTLRQRLPQAHITTYTYAPLIGVTSVTDPRGQKTTYHYDSYNRLEVIKDHNGHLLSKTEYNYKTLN
ncbi:hypothetical protein GCM10022259_02230 [Aquimarina mytili]